MLAFLPSGRMTLFFVLCVWKEGQPERGSYFHTNVWMCFKMFDNVEINVVEMSSSHVCIIYKVCSCCFVGVWVNAKQGHFKQKERYIC
jgi:hypothetical protein